jgi:L-ascorbate metabolism protein UlaG (beta-lactamase superfamily)
MRPLSLLLSLALALGCLPSPGLGAQEPGKATFTQRLTLPAPAAPVAPAGSASEGSIQFIGNATVLIRYQGFTILTDPNFLHKGDHVHLGYGLRSERLTNPALELSQLPPIDLVILSHLHEDHFDTVVQQQLNRDTPIVTTRESAENLQRMGFRKTVPLSTWDVLEVVKGDMRMSIASMPGRHGPPLVAALLPVVMGTMLDFPASPSQPRYRLYISGDTLVFDDIALIPHRYPGVNLALLHLGGTKILKTVKVTMDGQDGVQMMRIIAPEKAIPIHYNDYDVFKSPLGDFDAAVRAAGLLDKVIYLKHGDSYRFDISK